MGEDVGAGEDAGLHDPCEGQQTERAGGDGLGDHGFDEESDGCGDRDDQGEDLHKGLLQEA